MICLVLIFEALKAHGTFKESNAYADDLISSLSNTRTHTHTHTHTYTHTKLLVPILKSARRQWYWRIWPWTHGPQP